MQPFRLFAATGNAVARLDTEDGQQFATSVMLEDSGVQCVAVDPHDPQRVFVGTFDRGVFRTLDGGLTWEAAGEGIPHQRVLSIAISPSDTEHGRSVVYAGTEPSNLYRSDDDGQTWREFPELPKLPSAPGWSFPPRPWTSHVRWIALHHSDPRLITVGIELGGVMISRDGGETWEDRKPGSYHDSHAVQTHALAPGRIYEAAGGGVSMSDDAGRSWRTVDDGMDRHYVWGLAIDPADPDLWYVSASISAREAHRSNGQAEAYIYRRRADTPWERLNGGLPAPLPFMPYALLTLPNRPNTLIAGLQHGELLLTEDGGDSWRTLEVKLPGLLALADASTSS
jgi:photosystem II stability/assembly factor-like uncharacterized protein